MNRCITFTADLSYQQFNCTITCPRFVIALRPILVGQCALQKQKEGCKYAWEGIIMAAIMAYSNYVS